MTKDEFPLLNMKLSCPPEGDLQFGVFRKNGQQLKYIGKDINHTPGTLRAIPSGVLNRLAKLTSRKPLSYSQRVDNIYHEHANSFCKAGLASPNLPTMGYLWSNQDQKMDIEKEPDVLKKKT